ncbi:unnamed protein product [Brachionus calyciflorus]|uniref:HTH CENPB-type domain-containing protein n=1 Tax=Brachionus calyciflorus TaxID=104777 RepID=A0A814GC49_9BILA|nr:unnamed protein product [Brachionus calyciflorus]
MEKKLLEWFDDARRDNCCIDGKTLKVKAINLYDELYRNRPQKAAFQASDGWHYYWLNRNNKTYRRITTTGRELPSNSCEIINNFIQENSNVFRTINFDKSKIFNMDETSIYLDCPPK